MFPEKIAKISGYGKGSHNAVLFSTTLSSTNIIRKIRKMGIANFLTLDSGNMYDYSTKVYNDRRIDGIPQTVNNGTCCSFTKPNRWYLFPFHPTELAAVGLTEDNLIEYITFLNSLKCGFEYLYFGLQEGGEFVDHMITRHHSSYAGNGEYFWVGVKQKTNSVRNGYANQYHYAHWIHLRYLINSTQYGSNDNPYYLFPRIMFHLNKTKKLPKWQAFMFAYAATQWYGYYCLVDGGSSAYVPDLGLKPSEFKALLNHKGDNRTMNYMLTSSNPDAKKAIGFIPQAKHESYMAASIFGKSVDDFIAYMKKCYPSTKKRNVSAAKKITNGKKAAAKQ
jgi:hypothetical protein